MKYKTKSEKFVLSKREGWARLRSLFTKISMRGYSALTSSEAREFPKLFRLVCADLAEAKMLKLSPDVISYCNNLIAQAHQYMYSFPPLRKSTIKKFFRITLPNVIIHNWVFVLMSAVIFLLSYLITAYLVMDNPDLSRLFVSENVLLEMENSYRAGIAEARDAAMGSVAASFYIQNNVSIAFASFASGVLLGLGTVFFLIYNGITLGAISGYIVSLGYGKNFFEFVTAHSVFELSGLIIAGGAGLLLGYTIIDSKKYYRSDWLKLSKNNIFSLLMAGAILIFMAAFIEGFLSPSLIAYEFKVLIAIICGIAILIYFFIIPITQRKKYT